MNKCTHKGGGYVIDGKPVCYDCKQIVSPSPQDMQAVYDECSGILSEALQIVRRCNAEATVELERLQNRLSKLTL